MVSAPALAATGAAGLALAVALGGPRRPPPLLTINSPFVGLDYSTLPGVVTYRGSDGARLAYREYAPASAPAPGRGSVVLVHGSSASGVSMHPLALALARAGHRVYALDMRGHGASGPKGHIDRIGRLDDDVAAFLDAVVPPRPCTLAGLSAGGGFALRIAAGPHGQRFDSYLLLAPFLGQDAPTQRPAAGGWASVGLPRIIALTLLNRLGIRRFNHLPVLAFALTDEARAVLTPEYDYNLAANFRPEPDHRASLRRVTRPCAILAGTDDEAFHADRYEAVVRAAGQAWPVRLLPGIGHVQIVLAPAALAAVVGEVARLQG